MIKAVQKILKIEDYSMLLDGGIEVGKTPLIYGEYCEGDTVLLNGTLSGERVFWRIEEKVKAG